MLAEAGIRDNNISIAIVRSYIDLLMQPTGTEFSWSKRILILSSTIRKLISDKIIQIRGDNLEAKAARGAMMLTIGTVMERGMRLVRNMILTRLLAPEYFGLMGLVMAVMMLMEALTDVGVAKSVIQNKSGATKEYLNIAWWFRSVRGSGLTLLMVLSAPLICRFYEKPELLNLLRISFLSLLFYGFTSPRIFVLEKEFKFVTYVFLFQGCALFGTLLTIGLVFFIRNAWVLVLGLLGGAVLGCLLSYIVCPFRPSFSFDRGSLNELLRFCRRMIGLSFLTVVALQTDIFFLGKLMPTEEVGMYVMALALAQQPASIFVRTVGRVLLPTFSKKQDDKLYLCRAVLKVIKVTIMIGVPIMALAAIFARTILSVVYGSEYGAVALPFGILCFYMLFSLQGAILSNIYLAIGRPHLHRRYVLLLAFLIISLMYPGIKWFGLAGASGVLLLSNSVAVCMQVVWMRDVIGLRFKSYARCWLPVSLEKCFSSHNSFLNSDNK